MCRNGRLENLNINLNSTQREVKCVRIRQLVTRPLSGCGTRAGSDVRCIAAAGALEARSCSVVAGESCDRVEDVVGWGGREMGMCGQRK
jgi:hypothetical protein